MKKSTPRVPEMTKKTTRMFGSFLVHRKRFELLAFGSVDRRYIQLS